MARYFCTCDRGRDRPTSYQHTIYNVTEVDEEEICIYCGHYAFTRAAIQHELFPRHKERVTSLEVYKHIGNWEDNELFYQYYHGCGSGKQGLAQETLIKDQEKIRDAKKLKRANGNRG